MSPSEGARSGYPSGQTSNARRSRESASSVSDSLPSCLKPGYKENWQVALVVKGLDQDAPEGEVPMCDQCLIEVSHPPSLVEPVGEKDYAEIWMPLWV